MRRFWVCICVAILLAFLSGLVFGEVDLASQAVSAVKVRLTGRLPLQDWEVCSPAWFIIEKGWWSAPPGESERILYHPVGPRSGMLGVEGLELELTISSSEFDPEKKGFQFTVEGEYGNRESTEVTYTARELAVARKAAGCWGGWWWQWGDCPISLTVPMDPDYRLVDILLHLEGDITGVTIEKAELILR